MSKIIIIEGPNCVGKTTLSKYLSDKLMIPIYEHITDQHRWKNPTEGYIEFVTLYNMGIYSGLELICDRGLSSFAYYNREWGYNEIFTRWMEDLFKWDFARVICMMSDYSNLCKNALKKKNEIGEDDIVEFKEIDWFRYCYSLIPEEIKIECNINIYDESCSWMENILEEVLNG